MDSKALLPVTIDQMANILEANNRMKEKTGDVMGTHPFDGNMVVLIMNTEIYEALGIPRSFNLRIQSFEIQMPEKKDG